MIELFKRFVKWLKGLFIKKEPIKEPTKEPTRYEKEKHNVMITPNNERISIQAYIE